MKHYVYLWLRESGTPHYVGKGSGIRAFRKGCPKDRSRIIILNRSSSNDAFKTEMELIANWGRKDLKTGCLNNRTAGGEGGPWHAMPHSKVSKEKMSRARKGKKQPSGLMARLCASNVGRKHSEEWKRAASKRMKGNKNGIKGRPKGIPAWNKGVPGSTKKKPQPLST